MKVYFHSRIFIFFILFLIGDYSFLKAQEAVVWFYVGFCSDHKNIGLTCLMCKKRYADSDHYVKVCSDHYTELTKYYSCLECKKSITHKARLCSVCGEKDVCYICGKYLGSGDAGPARDKRKIVGQYNLTVTLPSKEKIYWDKAVEAMENKNYSEALNYFQKIYDVYPDGSLSCNIGRALLGLERYDDALKIFDRAIKEDPTWAESYYYKGVTLIKLSKYDEAEASIKKAIDLNITIGAAYIIYAVYMEETHKDYDQAIKYYEKGFDMSPNELTDYRNNLMKLYVDKNRFVEALTQADFLLKKDKNNSTYLDNKKLTLIKFAEYKRTNKEFDKAIGYYKDALEIDAKDIDALIGIADINYYDIKKFEEALRYYLISEEVSPDSPDIKYQIGNCYGQVNQLDKMESYFKKALAINPKLGYVQSSLAHLYLYQGKYNDAITIYKKLLLDKEATYPLYIDLAMCQYLNKQYQDVIESCKNFIKEDTENSPDPYKWMALASARLNNFKDAESYCKKAIELNTQNQKEVIYFVAAAYALMGKTEESLLNLEKALKAGMTVENIEKDTEFDKIRDQKQFKDLMNKYKSTTPPQQDKKETIEELKQPKPETDIEKKEITNPINELLHEDFEDQDCIFEPDEKWQLVNGEFVYSNPTNKNVLSWIRNKKIYSDITISVKVRWINKAKNYGYGIIFGSAKEEFYAFTISQDGRFRLVKSENDDWTSINPWTETNLTSDSWNTLKVSTTGKNIKCFLNDSLVVDIVYNSFNGGKAGLCCNGQVSAVFDDFIVSSPNK